MHPTHFHIGACPETVIADTLRGFLCRATLRNIQCLSEKMPQCLALGEQQLWSPYGIFNFNHVSTCSQAVFQGRMQNCLYSKFYFCKQGYTWVYMYVFTHKCMCMCACVCVWMSQAGWWHTWNLILALGERRQDNHEFEANTGSSRSVSAM